MKTPRERKPIDWQTVCGRLQRATAQLVEANLPSGERVRAILDERARVAARIPDQAAALDTVLEVLRFDLGPERFAIETSYLHGIEKLKDFSPVPGAPDFLVGVFNLRGQIIAIFDLRRFFSHGPTLATEQTRLILLGKDRVEFGLIADAVHDVDRLRLDAIRETPQSTAASARDFLRGVTADALLVFDGALLLSDPRLYIDLVNDKRGM